jgi:hypothetical protein
MILGVAIGCASDRKPEPSMQPASYEPKKAAPDTTNEPKSLPPQAPTEDGLGNGPEGSGSQDPGVLQKQAPATPPRTIGGTGGMSGTGGMAAATGRGGIGGTRSIGEGR